MDLGRYIHQVLKHRNEVYVKGLGTFKRIHTSAVYDESKAVYLPPMSYLEFDAKVQEGVDITDFIQQAHQVSRSDADALLEDAVVQLTEQLKDNGHASLNHLGQLIRHGSSLVFKAEDLSSFQLEAIDARDIRPTEDVSVPEETVEVEAPILEPVSSPITVSETSEIPSLEPEKVELEEQVEAAAVSEPDAMEENYFEEQNRSSSKAGWYIAVSVVALGIVGFLMYLNSTGLSQKPKQADTSSIVQEEHQVPVQPTAIDSNLVNQDSLTKIDSIKTDTVKTVAENKPLIPVGHQYILVIGKQPTLAKAFEQAESFNKAGIASVRVLPSKLARNKKTVIWDSYITKAEADSVCRIVQKRYVSDAWVQKL